MSLSLLGHVQQWISNIIAFSMCILLFADLVFNLEGLSCQGCGYY